MPLRFEVFGEQHIPAVIEFNRRMMDGRAPSDFLLPTSVEPPRASAEEPIRWTRFVVLDGEAVRGGLLEMDQPGWLNGQATRALNFQSPLSEGIVDPKYAAVAMQMVKYMQKQTNAVFMVGMGAIDRPLPKLLIALGWSVWPVPFLFRVHRAGPFLSELQMLKTSSLKRIAAQIARITGIGMLALAYKQRRKKMPDGTIRRVDAWGDWADEIWLRCRDNCSFSVLRDRRTLESLYPASDPQNRIYLVERDRKPVGWSVCFNVRLANHYHFGNLQVGSILDCLALPEAMASSAMLTDRELASEGADLVLVNHSHKAWTEAFHSAGFLSGPSNYMLAISKKLREALQNTPDGESRVHVTRGDGDGRIHLTA
jgi:hypothetical protein